MFVLATFDGKMLLLLLLFSVVEYTKASVDKGYLVLFTSIHHALIVGGATRTGDVLCTRLISPVDIITEWEESIGAERDISQLAYPFFAFRLKTERERGWLIAKSNIDSLPQSKVVVDSRRSC